jgi:mRNA interferase RelE/StbE
VRGLHPNLKRKTRAALRILVRNPYEGKSLRDDFEGLRSYRIGRFRIVYRISTRKHIEVVAIGPRKSIYEETLRLLKRDTKKSM